ncbi:hypothetical protein HC891_25365, partial [Candidatus Gracilibacteria bacterium]|nr:hypothetical protein [Candidatus Gracilibacteria bacterium]
MSPRRTAQVSAVPGALRAEGGQIEQGVEGRVAAANDEDAFAGVAGALCAEHIGDAVEDALGVGALARRGQ